MRKQHRVIVRDDTAIGCVVGPDASIIQAFDRLVGDPLDTAWASSPDSCAISSGMDEQFATSAAPVAVYRKSKPYGNIHTGHGEKFATKHFLFLKLAVPLQADAQYTIAFDEDQLDGASVVFTYDPASTRSDAVHVSHLGFRPDDPVKRAYLSCWMGSRGGIDYGSKLGFDVIKMGNDTKVFSGKTRLQCAADEAELNGTNNT